MFDFAVKGSVVGFNPSKDGTKIYMKIQPTNVNGLQLKRNERLGLLDVQMSTAVSKGLGVDSTVVVRGKGYVTLHDWHNPATNKQKPITNFYFEAETVEAAKAA